MMDNDLNDDLADAFATRLHGVVISRDELAAEFRRFGQRLLTAQPLTEPRMKLVMQIDGAQFMAEGPTSLVHEALTDWKATAGFDELAARKAFPVAKGFNRPQLTTGR